MRKMCCRRNKGIILTDTLIALLVTVSILPLAITVFRFCANFEFDYDFVNNEIAFMDLRRVILLAYDININEHELDFIYHGEDFSLRVVNKKLILQPGTQIYLNDINGASFYTKNGSIYISYMTKKGKEYERNIGKEKGIYLDDFLDNNDELFEFDSSDE